MLCVFNLCMSDGLQFKVDDDFRKSFFMAILFSLLYLFTAFERIPMGKSSRKTGPAKYYFLENALKKKLLNIF